MNEVQSEVALPDVAEAYCEKVGGGVGFGFVWVRGAAIRRVKGFSGFGFRPEAAFSICFPVCLQPSGGTSELKRLAAMVRVQGTRV